MKLSFSLKTKLTVWYLVIVAILLVFFGTVAYFTLSRSLYSKILYPWDMQLANIQISADGSSRITSVADLLPDELSDPQQRMQIVIRQLSKEELLSGKPITFSVPAGELNVDLSKIVSHRELTGKDIWLQLYIPPSNQENYRILVIQQSTGNAAIWLTAFRQTLLVISVITLAIAGVLGFLFVRQMLRPLKKMTMYARTIEQKNLDLRLDVRNHDELGMLAITLNNMLERLQGAFEREREFTADASHELRTPLSVIQGEVSLASYEGMTTEDYQKSMQVIGRQATRMATTIDRLMFLSMLDQSQENFSDNINLKSMLQSLVEDMQVISDSKGVKLDLEATDKLTVKGNFAYLRVLFLNLIENALKYTPSGGKVSVQLARINDQAIISVVDTGIGIASEHLSHIFQRFYRVDKSRSRTEGGDGLGLAICKRIAELFGGSIEVQSRLKIGSTFTVLLPVAEPGKPVQDRQI